MNKREVSCTHCGYKWETQAPFSETMCPNCHKRTHIDPPTEERKVKGPIAKAK